tara:strand:+ start:263 stop:1090 length:828 start_codon:yes stop_codon:yes gene_type:complete
MPKNSDKKVINDFGEEWNVYKQDGQYIDLKKNFLDYFSVLPEKFLNKNAVGFDAGCGSGRWAKFVAPKVKKLHCIDPSEKALLVAKKNLKIFDNCEFHSSSINSVKIREESMDFGYCLGVLHHIPNTISALKYCVSMLKKEAPMLIYIYYSFDNKPYWFKLIWKMTDILRKLISRLPFPLKLIISRVIALLIYFPLARISLLIEKIGFDVSNLPLSSYRSKSFYTMLTDSLDRFGTKLEKRFSKKQIHEMMTKCGLKSIKFSDTDPYWVCVGYKK